MNAEDGSEEPGIEENKNPDLDCEFENANDDAALSEGRYSTYKKVCQRHPEYLVMFCAKFKSSMLISLECHWFTFWTRSPPFLMIICSALYDYKFVLL